MPINVDSNMTGNEATFAQNILNQYYSYTYNFTLSLYDQTIAKEVRLPTASDNHIIIAQSGVTSQFFIRKVDFQSYAGVTREGKGSSPTSIVIEVDEPLGFTLIDRLLQAGVALNLPGLNQVPYVLELSFVGWDENGNIVNPIIGQPKVWVMNLLTVVPDFSKKGTSYTLSFAPRNDQVQDNVRCSAPKSIVIKKEPTLSATLTNLANAFTYASTMGAEGNIQTPTGNANATNSLKQTYVINTQDGDTALSKLSTWTMQQNAQQGGDQQTASSDPNLGITQFDITAKPGTDIFEIITGVLANTNEAYKHLCPAASPDQTDFTSNQLTSFFHYDTTTVNTVYDSVSGTYSQTHTITIVPKYVTRNSSNTTTPGGADSVNNLMSMNLLNRAYNYIFTGDNTEILDLNINLSSFWTDTMPLYLTLLKDRNLSVNQSPSLSPANVVPPPVLAANKAQSQQTTNQQTPFALTANRPDAALMQNNAYNTFSQNGGVINNTATSGNVSSGSATNSNDANTAVTSQYLEDLPTAAWSIESFSRKEPDRDYAQTISSVQGYSSVGNIASNSKISIFGYLADLSFANTRSNFISSMLNISLMIKGDPFWLGITPEEAQSAYSGQTYANIRTTQDNYAVFQSGENNFYLRFRIPTQIDDTTGLMQISDSSCFNMLYSVIQINSTFENGTFKQELMAYANRSFSQQAVQNTLNPILTQTNPGTMSNFTQSGGTISNMSTAPAEQTSQVGGFTPVPVTGGITPIPNGNTSVV